MRGKLWRAVCLLLLFGTAVSWALGGGGGGSTESKKLIGGKGGSVSYRRDTVDIQLKNVSYIQQNIETAPGSGIYEARSNMYCGLASAMMVRAMGEHWPSEHSRALDYWSVRDVAYNNNELRAWDNLLLTNARLVYSQNLDVTYNGLLHTGRHYDDQNYEDTKNLLQHIYTLNDFSGYAIRNQDNVVACDMRPVEVDEVMDIIWNHIETYKKPVVTLIDSSKIRVMQLQWNSSSQPITLHYNVVYGISNIDGVRKFYVYDPWHEFNDKEYDEEKYQWMMTLTSSYNTFWLYEYARTYPPYIDKPCYLMTIH